MHNYSLAQAARMLGTGRNRLIRALKERGIIDHQRIPAQRHIDAGRFTTELRQHTGNPDWNQGNGQLYTAALVTPDGMRWLAAELGCTFKDMSAPEVDPLEQARSAINLLKMHINCPTAVDSATALAVADEALQMLDKRRAA